MKPSSKKILILSSSFGQGHMATARALQSAAQANPQLNLEIEIIDFSKEVNQLFDKTSKKLYELNTKHTPSLYKWMYISTDITHTPIRLANLLNYPLRQNHLKQLLQNAQPDLIISNYPIWQYLAYQISKKLFHDVEFATLITDSITVHSSWVIPDSDFYLVSNQQTANSLHALDVDETKIFPLGYPVHQTFAEPAFSASKLREKYQFPAQRKLFLFSASALKTSYVRRVATAITAHYPDITLVVVTGRDNELHKALKDDPMWNLPHAVLLDWVDDMPSLIRASEIVITKAGGSTVMECIAAKKPLIINKIIPGQEEGNAELVEVYGLGKVARKSTEILTALQEISLHYDDYIQRLSRESRPTAASDILNFLRQRLDHAT